MAELINTINSTLEKLNVQTNLIEPKTLEQITKIESVLSDAFAIQENAKAILKDNRPSINNTASKSKLSRQTIYNHDLLKKYIEFRIHHYNELDPFKKNERLLEKISALENQIQDMMIRDINLELMRRKITLLEEEFKLVKKENKELQVKYNNLKRNEKDPSNNNSKITHFPHNPK